MGEIIKFKDIKTTSDEIAFEESTLKILFRFIEKRLSIWLVGAESKKQQLIYFNVIETIASMQDGCKVEKYPPNKIVLTIPHITTRQEMRMEMDFILHDIMDLCVETRAKWE